MIWLSWITILSTLESPSGIGNVLQWKGTQPNNIEVTYNSLTIGPSDMQGYDEIINMDSCYFIFSYSGYMEMEPNSKIEIIIRDVSDSNKILKTTTFELDSEALTNNYSSYRQFTLKELTGLNTWYPVNNQTNYNTLSFTIELDVYDTVASTTEFFNYSMGVSIPTYANYNEFEQDAYKVGYEQGQADGYRAGNESGLKDGYNTGYNDGFAKGTDETNTPSINWLKKLMLSLNDILSIELFPNFRLSYVIGIFIIFPILSWILHWFR